MANGENGNRFITWQMVLSALAGLLLICLAGIVADTRQGITQAQDKIDKIQTSKVDKEQYRCDIERVESKLDKLITMHISTNGKSK